MASQYTGNPTASQSPSPAPSLGNTTDGDPIGNLPTDGQAFNADAFNQAYKVDLDWIAFFRRKLFPFSGVRAWDSTTLYAEGDIVRYATNGKWYAAAQANSAQAPLNNLTYWLPVPLTAAEIIDLVESENYGTFVSTSADGIAVTGSGVALVTSSILYSTYGVATVIKRLSLQLTFGADATASIVLSGEKAFTDSAVAIRSVQVTNAPGSTGSNGTVWGYRHATTHNCVVVGMSGLGGQGGGVNVTIEGY